MKILVFLIILTASKLTLAVGSEHGNNFETIGLSGYLRVQCSPIGERTEFATHQCDTLVLTPAEFSRIKATVEADEVELVATNKDGTVRKKSSKFQDGFSKKNFNLWIYTLTQKPLLNYGENNIAYKFTLGGNEVLSGEFIANVNHKETRYCPGGFEYSYNAADCSYANKESICWRYFQNNNFCK